MRNDWVDLRHFSERLVAAKLGQNANVRWYENMPNPEYIVSIRVDVQFELQDLQQKYGRYESRIALSHQDVYFDFERCAHIIRESVENMQHLIQEVPARVLEAELGVDRIKASELLAAMEPEEDMLLRKMRVMRNVCDAENFGRQYMAEPFTPRLHNKHERIIQRERNNGELRAARNMAAWAERSNELNQIPTMSDIPHEFLLDQ